MFLPCNFTATVLTAKTPTPAKAETPGASCSKLTTSLHVVNVTLKFKCKYYKYADIFCWKNVRIFCSAKDSHIFPTKKNCVFDNVVGIYLTSRRLKDVVGLTIL